MDKIDILLRYLQQLQMQLHEANEYDGESDAVLKRINKVNDLIEAELTKP